MCQPVCQAESARVPGRICWLLEPRLRVIPKLNIGVPSEAAKRSVKLVTYSRVKYACDYNIPDPAPLSVNLCLGIL